LNIKNLKAKTFFMVGDYFTSHFYCMLKGFVVFVFFMHTENIFAQRLELGLADSSNVRGAILLDTTPRTRAVVKDTIVKTEIATIKDSVKVNGISTAKDTANVAKKHSPTKAAILSAALPGLGQAYNKKYWKIPIVYAGFAGLGFWIGTNVKNYRTYREAYQYRLDGKPETIDQFVGQYQDDDLKTLKNFYRRNMDLSIILTAVWYSLNIIDAAVDAHLFEFDVSDNLSLRVEPVLEYQSRANNLTGLKVGLRF
jgi:hypothetical protein